ASEGALSPFVEGGYHHALYGADVVLQPMNLCVETLDAVRNHSWHRPAPMTPEGETVACAARFSSDCDGFEDAVAALVVRPDELTGEVREVVGTDRRSQRHACISVMCESIGEADVVAMRLPEADALAAFRSFNFERIYLRPAA